MPKQEASEEYPVGTQAVLACKGPYHSIPSPNIVVCSAEKGSWSDATCYSKDSPIGPQNTNPNQIGPTAGSFKSSIKVC